MARLPRLFRTRSWVPRKKIPWLQIWDNLVWFSFLYWKRYIVCSHWNRLSEAILMRTHNIPSCYRKSKRSLLRLLTWRYNQPSFVRTTPVSNYFSWSQTCSSHWSSTVGRVLGSFWPLSSVWPLAGVLLELDKFSKNKAETSVRIILPKYASNSLFI